MKNNIELSFDKDVTIDEYCRIIEDNIYTFQTESIWMNNSFLKHIWSLRNKSMLTQYFEFDENKVYEFDLIPVIKDKSIEYGKVIIVPKQEINSG